MIGIRVALLLLLATNCYSAEVKATGVAQATIVDQEEVTPPEPILVYTEEGPTLQVVF
mgnify:CR=1 FL=1